MLAAHVDIEHYLKASGIKLMPFLLPKDWTFVSDSGQLYLARAATSRGGTPAKSPCVALLSVSYIKYMYIDGVLLASRFQI